MQEHPRVVRYAARMHRRTLLGLVFLLFAAPLALAACSKPSPPLKELTVDEVQAKLAANDGKTYVYDCNDEGMFKAGHVPGAKWVEQSTVPANELPQDKTATLVFYCANEH